MSEKTYNGWTNYETWNLALWIDNEQGSQEYWRERAAECFKDARGMADITGDDRERDARAALAEELKSQTEENVPEIGNSFYADVLNAAISEVNWYEIAGNWIDEVKDEILEEEKSE